MVFRVQTHALDGSAADRALAPDHRTRWLHRIDRRYTPPDGPKITLLQHLHRSPAHDTSTPNAATRACPRTTHNSTLEMRALSPAVDNGLPTYSSPFFFFLMIRPPPKSPLFPYTTLSR